MAGVRNIKITQQRLASLSVKYLDAKAVHIYVLVTRQDDLDTALYSEEYSRHTVIRRRTVAEEVCFVDDSGCSYTSWQSFLANNRLPEGIMVGPENGMYSFDADGSVSLEVHETPARIEAKKGSAVTIRTAQQDFAFDFQDLDDGAGSAHIFVMVTKQEDLASALDSQEFTWHPVIRKEVAGDNNEKNYYFLDENGRNYEHWNAYVRDNDLPDGIMVGPENGMYSFDADGSVLLEVHETPARIEAKKGSAVTIRTVQQDFAFDFQDLDDGAGSAHIFVMVTKQEDLASALDSQEFTWHPVIRKEVAGDNNEKNYYFLDENGRNYEHWNAYVRDNDLPDGIMVGPENGIYSFDANGKVMLDVHKTPARLTAQEDTVDNGVEVHQVESSTIRNIRQIQQDLAETAGHNQDVIWDLLAEDQGHILKKKIKELIPDQEKGQNKIDNVRATLYDSIWAQRKYTNRNSLTSIIYVFVARCDSVEAAPTASEYSCHPVFRARKCKSDDNSSQCCMVFIDEYGRVYQNWAAYLKNNLLPEGVMIGPRKGIYSFDSNRQVELEVCTTPAASIGNKALAVADKTTVLAGLGAAAVPIAALLTTVAAPIVAGAAVICATTAAYSTVRSVCHLADRKQHEQSISITNREAVNSYIGIGAGVVGVAASGATKAMTAAAAAGKEVSLITEVVVNGMNISSIVLSGAGLGVGALDLIMRYRDDEEISGLDYVQLAASLVLFTHSLTNFRLASSLVTDTRHNTIQEYRKNLSRNQRRMFDKLSKETVRIRGAGRGQIDIVRSVNEIPNKQYLNDLYKINKKLNQQQVRPSFGAAGEGVVLNNQVPVDTAVLRGSVQHNVGPNVLGQVTQPIPATHDSSGGQPLNAARMLYVSPNQRTVTSDIQSGPLAGVQAFGLGMVILPSGVRVALSDFGTRLFEIIVNAESCDDVITTMANLFSEETFRFLMHVAQVFVEKHLEKLRTVLKIFISAETILFRILEHCMTHYFQVAEEYLRTKQDEIITFLKKYFNRLNPNNFRDLLKKCDVCDGWFSECRL